MANFYLEAYDHRTLVFEISGLEYRARDYDWFYVTDIYCGNGQVSNSDLDYDDVKKTFTGSGSGYNFYGQLEDGENRYININPDTRYRLYCYASYKGKIWYIGADSCRTPDYAKKPDKPQGFRLTDRYNNALEFSWYSVSDADEYEVGLKNIYTGEYDFDNTTRTYLKFRGLDGGTLYECSVCAKNDAGSSDWAGFNRYLTYPNEPNLTIYEKGKDYIKIKVSCTDNWNYVNVVCSQTGIVKKVYQNDSNKVVTFSGLASGKTYNFDGVTYVNYNGTNYTSSRVSISSSTISNPRPNNFYWQTAKTSTECRLDDVEWNSFTDHINKFRRYKSFSDYSFSKAYEGNYFKAVQYNQAVNALKDICNTGLSTVNSGQSIDKATLSNNLNIMVNRLNAIT